MMVKFKLNWYRHVPIWLITNSSTILQLSMPMTLYTRTRRIPLRYEATSSPDPQMLEVEEVEEEEVSPATT